MSITMVQKKVNMKGMCLMKGTPYSTFNFNTEKINKK